MFWGWVRVLWREFGLNAIKGVWRGFWELRDHGVSKAEWIRRTKVCMKCPIYDARYKQCRLGNLGCGCYVPYSNLVYRECWMRKKYGKGFGWGWDDKKSEVIQKLNRNWEAGLGGKREKV
jgi:hypothetical protein